jgi:redox-sensitive bicupin YhaK (pirin superfamily)
LIERTREGDANARSLLRQTNALLSEIVAAEFPLVGVRRDRIKQAREDYQKLVSAG